MTISDPSMNYLILISNKAERRSLEAKHEFDHASKLIKSEVARFEQERVEDFKDSLQRFLDGMISRQKEVRDSLQRVALRITSFVVVDRCMGEFPASSLEKSWRRRSAAAYHPTLSVSMISTRKRSPPSN